MDLHTEDTVSPQPAPAPPAAAPRATPVSTRSIGPGAAHVLSLQRAAGNQAVVRAMTSGWMGRAPVAAPATVSPELVEAMRADVEMIVGLLSEQILTSSEEARIVAKVRLYADMDADQAGDGPADTPRLDKFLLLLKGKAFPRSTARSGWIEQWVNAYDTCWHELEDDNLTEFAAIVGRSTKQGTKGPDAPQEESLYSFVGKHEAMGVWGILKGLGLTLSGVADVAIWAAWKQTGAPLGVILEQFGIKDASKTPALTPYLSKSYDEVAKLMGDTMGVDPSKDQTLFGQSSYEIGEFGGKVVGALTMAGAGGGTAGETVMQGTKVLSVLGAVKGIEESGAAIATRIAEMRKRKPPPSVGEMLTDESLLLDTASILANALGAAAGAGDAAPKLAQALKGFGLAVDVAQLAPAVGKAWKDYNDPALAADPEKRDAALRDHAANILGTILSTVGSKHQEAADARAEQAKASFDAAFQERYNTPPEGAGGGDGGGARGGGGGDGGGGDGGDGGGGREDLFGPRDSWIGGDDVLEPHPGGHQNPPEFLSPEQTQGPSRGERAGLFGPELVGASAADYDEAGARLRAIAPRAPDPARGTRRAAAEVHLDGAETPRQYVERSGEPGVTKPIPRSDITMPERHVTAPPWETTIPPDVNAPPEGAGLPADPAQRDAFLDANRAEPEHPYSRAHDAEAKVLERISADLPPNARGTVHLAPTHAPCPACINAIHTFKGQHPGMTVVLH